MFRNQTIMLFEYENSLVLFSNVNLLMVLEFLEAAVNLKKVSRQGWIDKLNIETPESVADHAYSLAVLSMVFSDLGHYNSEKIMKMALLHDLAESKVGDFTPDKIDKFEKERIENLAFKEIVSTLPESLKEEYLEIWHEYVENNSKESQLLHQLDKLEMALQAKVYEKEGHSRINLETFLQTAESEIIDPDLKELFTQIIQK